MKSHANRNSTGDVTRRLFAKGLAGAALALPALTQAQRIGPLHRGLLVFSAISDGTQS